MIFIFLENDLKTRQRLTDKKRTADGIQAKLVTAVETLAYPLISTEKSVGTVGALWARQEAAGAGAGVALEEVDSNDIESVVSGDHFVFVA